MIKDYNPDSNNVITGADYNEEIVWAKTWFRNLTVYAKGGNDIIDFRSSAYKNTLYGNNGKDTIYGGFASDTISGGKGNDYICGFKGSDFLYGNKGNDTVYGGKGNDYINGNSGNDYLIGNEGKDTIYGATGNDYIYGDVGKDKLYGEKGNDTIWGGDGKDAIYGGNGNDTVYGGADNDVIYGNNGNDKLYGDDGNDKLRGGNGNDTIFGGNGNDTIYTDNGNDLITAGKGKDVIYVADGYNTVYSGTGNDKIYISNGTNHIFGDEGNDKIYITGGKSTLYFKTGDGNDTISNSSSVTIFSFDNSNLKFINDNSDLIITYGNNDSVRIKNYTSNSKKYFIKTNNSKISIEDYKNSLSRGDKGITVKLEKNVEKIISLKNTFDGIDYRYTLSTTSLNKSVYIEYLTNGRLYIKASDIHLTADSGQKDDLIILGSNNTIDTGDKDDIVRSGYIIDSNGYYDKQSNYNTINTGSGNDYVTFFGFRNTINTGSGNDSLYGVSANTNLNSQNITNAENISIGEENTAYTDGKIGSFYQGYSGGDCRFLAIMESLSYNSGFKLSKYITITADVNNSYTVKYNNYKSGQNSVNITSSDLNRDLCVYGDLDIVLADIALNKLISINRDAGNSSIYNADYNTLSDYIFGTKATTYLYPSYNNNYEKQFAELWNSYKNGKINNFTVGIFAGEDLSKGIVANHAYAVQDFSDEYIILTNVWDTLDHLTLDTDTFFNLSTSVFVYGCDYYKNSQYIVQGYGSFKDEAPLYDYNIDSIQSEIASWDTGSSQDYITDIKESDNINYLPTLFISQDNNITIYS